MIVEKVLDNTKLLSITRKNSSVASIDDNPHAGTMVTQAQQTDLSFFAQQEVKAKSEKVSSSTTAPQKMEESKTSQRQQQQQKQQQHNSKPQPKQLEDHRIQFNEVFLEQFTSSSP